MLSARDFHAALDADPGAARELLRIVAARLRDARPRMRVEFATLDTLGRVATRLLELPDRFGQDHPDGRRIDLPLSQDGARRPGAGPRARRR